MSDYIGFFLNSDSSIVPLETLEISHPSFSKTYYIVRNAPINGITATLEDGTTQNFDYYPLSIKKTGSSDDLDQTLDIQLGDLGAEIPNEIDRCFAADTMLTKPTLIYRVYRSDDLTAPMDGPFRFEIASVPRKKAASGFQASAPKVNVSRTGQQYTLTRFPMLRALV